MLPAEAAALLPAFQQATLYAAAGEDRTDRLLEAPSPDVARPPMCGVCGYTASTQPDDDQVRSGECAEVGHDPFGYGRGYWQIAVDRYREHAAALTSVRRLPGSIGTIPPRENQ